MGYSNLWLEILFKKNLNIDMFDSFPDQDHIKNCPQSLILGPYLNFFIKERIEFEKLELFRAN